MSISRLLINSIKLSDLRAYRIAHAAGLHPSTLSRLMNGIEIPQKNDPRVISIGRVLGIPASECFDNGGAVTNE